MRTALALLFALWIPTVASADRLFTCGLEENNIVAVGASAMWTAVADSPTVSTTTVRSGTYALRAQGLTTTHPNITRGLAASISSGTVYARFYYRFPTLPASDLTIFKTSNSGGTNSAVLTLKTTGVLSVSNAVTATADDGAIALSTGTWYRIELRQLLSNTVGEMEVRIDGVSDMSITGEDTLNTNLGFFVFGENVNDHAHDQFYDDIAINDANGSFQNSWPGDGKIVYVEGAADDAVAWTKAGSAPAATNFEGVDEIPGAPDDGTTFNEDSGTTNEDRLGLSTIPAEVDTADTMVLLDIYARVQAGAASQTMRMLVWDNSGSQSTGASIALANGTWAILTTAQHLVASLSGKSKANAQDYDIGYEGLVGASAKRVTALWANVEYQEGGAPPATGLRGTLLGVGP